MEKNMFFDLCLETLKNRFRSTEYEVKVEDVWKNNAPLKGIMICQRKEWGTVGGPVVYPELLCAQYPAILQNENTMTEFLENLCSAMEDAVKQQDLIWFKKQCLEPKNLRLAVVNYEKNKGSLEACPHRHMEDLAVYVRSVFETKDDNIASGHITYGALKEMGISEEELFNLATINTGRKKMFQPLSQLMCSIFDQQMEMDLPDSFCPDLYILSTEDAMYGAGLIACMDVLQDIYNQLGTGFYILPSSIHEVLILQAHEKNESNTAAFKDMVREINHTEVDPKDVLSDSVYWFNGYACERLID